MNKFYITTTLPYVNAAPHIGHTLEFIQADVIARYFSKKLGEENVWFNVGSDEHGLKIVKKAEEEGLTPKELTDKYANIWKDFCKLFQISYKTFYRTSEEYHIAPAQEFWKAADKAGDIYKKKYEGLYCVGCEEFKTEKDLIDGKCPLHGVEPIKYAEENYFFKLSKYKDNLLEWLEKNPETLKPVTRLEELKNWIKNMEDISISRSKENLPWGVPVPGDDSQVFYVWFDALTNYVNVLGYGSEKEEEKKRLEEYWPGVQIFGVDNLRFQGAIWQGMLASAGLLHTSKLLCHGFVLAEDGTKMSKTKGNVVSPFEQQEKYGTEAVRFYLVAGLSTYGDSAYQEEELKNLYNDRLANNFGNLLNRVVHLAGKREVEINEEDKVEDEFKDKVNESRDRIEKLFEDFELSEAFEEINNLANFGNEYITKEEPWGKDKLQENVAKVLNNLSYLLQTVSELYAPVIPESSAKALEMLKNREGGVLFEKFE